MLKAQWLLYSDFMCALARAIGPRCSPTPPTHTHTPTPQAHSRLAAPAAPCQYGAVGPMLPPPPRCVAVVDVVAVIVGVTVIVAVIVVVDLVLVAVIVVVDNAAAVVSVQALSRILSFVDYQS